MGGFKKFLKFILKAVTILVITCFSSSSYLEVVSLSACNWV